MLSRQTKAAKKGEIEAQTEGNRNVVATPSAPCFWLIYSYAEHSLATL